MTLCICSFCFPICVICMLQSCHFVLMYNLKGGDVIRESGLLSSLMSISRVQLCHFVLMYNLKGGDLIRESGLLSSLMSMIKSINITSPALSVFHVIW